MDVDEENDRNDLFEEAEESDDNTSHRGGGGSDADAEGDKDKKKDDKKKKPKKKTNHVVKRMMLSEDQLNGRNGIVKLEEVFRDFEFGGRGKEKKDLDRMLHKLEHWVHVLDPRHPFDQSLERIEFLGLKKKSLKNQMKKIRMGLICHHDVDLNEPVLDFGPSDDENDQLQVSNATPSQSLNTNTENNESVVLNENEIDEDDDWMLANMDIVPDNPIQTNPTGE